MAADLQTAAGDRERTGARRQFGAQHLHQRSEPEALGLDGRDAACLERQRGDRSHAGGQHIVFQCVQQQFELSSRLGAGEQRRGGRRTGEGDGVQGARDDRVQQPVHGGQVLRGHPPVDGDEDDIGARDPQRLDESGQRFAVQLEGDPAAGDSFGEEPVEDLGHGLRGR